MSRIGKKQILHVETFILPEGEELFLEFQLPGAEPKFRVRFLQSSDSKSSVLFEAGEDPDDAQRGLLTFTNWNKPGRITTKDAIGVMENESNTVLIAATSEFIQSTYFVTLQFLLEEKA